MAVLVHSGIAAAAAEALTQKASNLPALFEGGFFVLNARHLCGNFLGGLARIISLGNRAANDEMAGP